MNNGFGVIWGLILNCNGFLQEDSTFALGSSVCGGWGGRNPITHCPHISPSLRFGLGTAPKEPQGQARSRHSNPGPVSSWHKEETRPLKSSGEQTESLKGAGPPALGGTDSGHPWELLGAVGEKWGRGIEPGFASNHSGYLG